MQFPPLPQSTLLKCYLLALKQQEITYLKEIQIEKLFNQTIHFIQPKLKYIAQNTVITGKTTLKPQQLYKMYQILAIDFIKKQIDNIKQYSENETLHFYQLIIKQQIKRSEMVEETRKEDKNYEIKYL